MQTALADERWLFCGPSFPFWDELPLASAIWLGHVAIAISCLWRSLRQAASYFLSRHASMASFAVSGSDELFACFHLSDVDHFFISSCDKMEEVLGLSHLVSSVCRLP